MTNPTQVTWIDPTTNTDGTPLAAGEVTGYTIGVGTATGVYAKLVPVASATAVSEALAALGLTPGTAYFVSIRTESVNGPSAWGPEVQYTPPLPVPNAPTGFSLA